MLDQVSCTIMKITRSTIIRKNTPDSLWPEIALAIVHVKNLRPTCKLDSKTLYELFKIEIPSLNHLKVLESTV